MKFDAEPELRVATDADGVNDLQYDHTGSAPAFLCFAWPKKSCLVFPQVIAVSLSPR